MTRSLRRPLGWLVVIPAIVIAAVVYLSGTIERGITQNAARATHGQEALLTAMLDQETGARGYFATGKRAFLQPWYSGAADYATTLGQARRAADGDSQLLRDLRWQARLAIAWHDQTAGDIAALEAAGTRPTATTQLARKAVMDAFRTANADYAEDLDQRRATSLAHATVLSVAFGAVIALIITVSGVALLRRWQRRERSRRRDESELRQLLQVSDSEQESRALLSRYIETVVPGAGAAVLNRNNSDNRLERSLTDQAAATPLRDLPEEPLEPRACLAIRLNQPQARARDERSFAACDVCGKLVGDIACEPLLVGGQVIGAVLVASDGRIGSRAREKVGNAVSQAAPIMANQRNLWLAETRATSDALTGLPNRRAAEDTLKRMAAQASRSVSPLAAVLLDLDHFKQINDVHGHEQGDEALAAVGAILGATLRASDFASRFGGEEFLVLLPDTSRAQASVVAEKLRVAIAALELASGPITASFGVAAVPEDAIEPDQLVRKADRALYVAKRSGRNRVELASTIAAQPDAPSSPSMSAASPTS